VQAPLDVKVGLVPRLRWAAAPEPLAAVAAQVVSPVLLGAVVAPPVVLGAVAAPAVVVGAAVAPAGGVVTMVVLAVVAGESYTDLWWR